MIDNRGNVPGFPLGPSTTDYSVRDFDINTLPEKNHMQRVIEDFVSRRHAFQQTKGRSGTQSSNADACSSSQLSHGNRQKPRLDEFLKCFQEKVIEVNKAYASSKEQFETIMRLFDKDDTASAMPDGNLWNEDWSKKDHATISEA